MFLLFEKNFKFYFKNSYQSIQRFSTENGNNFQDYHLLNRYSCWTNRFLRTFLSSEAFWAKTLYPFGVYSYKTVKTVSRRESPPKRTPILLTNKNILLGRLCFRQQTSSVSLQRTPTHRFPFKLETLLTYLDQFMTKL